MTTVPNFTVKSQLAKLLATENITIRHDPNARTASFNVQSRDLVLPVWQDISEDLYDMLVVHEVGHALDTPLDGWVDTIDSLAAKHHGDKAKKAKSAIKNFLNVVEDARIDKRQKRRYPGSRRNYVVGYKELMERNFFGTMGKDVNSLTLIDRLNLYFKGGFALDMSFTAEEKAFVKRMENAETFEDVIAITDDLYGFARQSLKDEPEESQIDEDYDNSDESFDGDADYDDEDSDEFSDETSTKASGEETDGEKSDEDDSTSGEDGDEEHEDETNSFGSDEETDDEYIPDSETEKAAQNSVNSIVRDNDMNYIYVTLPKPNYEKIVDDFSVVIPQMASFLNSYGGLDEIRAEIAKFRREENDAISFMVKEFEMRKSADTYSRATIAKTGVIDTNKIHSYRYNDDIFRKLSVVPSGKNHGFFMLLDWSGSMVNNFQYTIKQLMALTLFCKRVQIPFEVYSFRDTIWGEKDSFTYKDGDIVFSSFKLRNVLSSRMNVATLNRAFECLWAIARRYNVPCDPMGSTPLNQAILVADKLVNDFRKKYKLQIVSTIVLTDGASDYPFHVHNNKAFSLPVKPKGNYYILRDDVTKRLYNMGSSYYLGLTPMLLNILRDRTQSNLVGFFMHRGSLNGVGYLLNGRTTEMEKAWKNDGYLTLTSAGYDEYYIIKSVTQSVDTTLNVNSKMTKAKIAKEFIKFSEKKGTSRVLLSKFMKRACTVKMVA